MSSPSHQSWIALRRYSVDNLMKIYDDSFDHFIASVVHVSGRALGLVTVVRLLELSECLPSIEMCESWNFLQRFNYDGMYA